MQKLNAMLTPLILDKQTEAHSVDPKGAASSASMCKSRFVTICKWCTRWLAILLLSILITLPFVVVSIELAGNMARADLGIDEADMVGKDDLGSGFIIVSYLFVAAIGSFIVVWPFALWASHKLVNRLLRNHFKFLKG